MRNSRLDCAKTHARGKRIDPLFDGTTCGRLLEDASALTVICFGLDGGVVKSIVSAIDAVELQVSSCQCSKSVCVRFPNENASVLCGTDHFWYKKSG